MKNKEQQESYQSALSLLPQHAPNGLPRTRSQKVDQERHAIQILRPLRRSVLPDARKLPIEITRKISGQPGRKMAHQSLAGDLRQHPAQAVADRKLDTG